MPNGTSETPICDLIERLVLSRVTGVTVTRDSVTEALAAARPVELALQKNPMSTMEKREKDRVRQAAWRARTSRDVTRDKRDKRESALTYLDSSYNTEFSQKKGSKKVSKVSNVTPVTRDKPMRNKGHELPVDWKPTEKHYAKGETLGFHRGQIDWFAERMRNWAEANKHRAVARKSNWDAAFSNWIADKAGRDQPRGGVNGQATGHQQSFPLARLAMHLKRRQQAGEG
jgi:hypothetical protein